MINKNSVNNPDSLLPSEMAVQAEYVGVTKAHMSIVKTTSLAVLAGAFIAFGAVFSTIVTAGSTMSFGVTKLLGGITFSLGLILVVIGGAELFTGNNLMIMAWANRKIKTTLVLKNWLFVYAGNMIGATSIVILIILSGHYLFGGGIIGSKILHIAKSKCELGFTQAIVLGVLCNILVCLAICSATVQNQLMVKFWPLYSPLQHSLLQALNTALLICISFPWAFWLRSGRTRNYGILYRVHLNNLNRLTGVTFLLATCCL